jgi:hypothetical protein
VIARQVLQPQEDWQHKRGPLTKLMQQLQIQWIGGDGLMSRILLGKSR